MDPRAFFKFLIGMGPNYSALLVFKAPQVVLNAVKVEVHIL